MARARFGMLMGLLAISLLGVSPAEQPGYEIAQRCDVANNGFKSERAEMTMDLINAHGEITSRKLVIETLEGVEDGDKSLSTFTWPADVKGTKLLTWSHRRKDDDQWLYLPALKRTKRISSSNKTGSFMGSEFAYEDFGSQEVDKYTYVLVGDATEAGRATWQLERVPVDSDSGYRRQRVWMDKEYMNPIRIDYYDRKNALLKRATFLEYRRYGTLWRPGKIEMANVQTKKRSIIVWSSRRLHADLPSTLFVSEALGK